jgi:hypothetical protein
VMNFFTLKPGERGRFLIHLYFHNFGVGGGNTMSEQEVPVRRLIGFIFASQNLGNRDVFSSYSPPLRILVLQVLEPVHTCAQVYTVGNIADPDPHNSSQKLIQIRPNTVDVVFSNILTLWNS